MTKVGLLGGTFDPPHLGHLAVAKTVLNKGLVDIVWLLPCWKHAFGKNPSHFHHRASMCFLMVKEETNIYVCTAESEIRSSYSVEILKYIRDANHGKTFRLILGTDNYWRMNEWKEKDKVIGLAPPIWVGRPHTKEIPEPVVECHFDISSTEIRNLISNKKPISNHLLYGTVKDYIVKHSLYLSA
jgi:nicotinate-nucleotide adenylyltransferase